MDADAALAARGDVGYHGTMKTSSSLPHAALAALLLASGCSSSSTGTNNPVPCALPSGVSDPVLVYPAPGSTPFGPSVTQIVVATQGGSLVSGGTSVYNVAIIDALNPGGVPGGTFVSTSPPFPSPSQPPPYSNPFYQTSSFSGGFASGQTVSVFVNNANSNCAPLSIGTFRAT